MKGNIKKAAAALAAAGILTAVSASGLLSGADGVISDTLYHRPSATDGEIVVVGMDQQAIDAFGPMPWPRDIIADAIGYLNADPEQAPAVIGIDVLFVSESGDPAADELLVDAAESGGNVVTAAAATFGSELVTDAEDFYMDTRAVLAWDTPFEALAAVTETGHINAMADNDGYLRHALARVQPPEGPPVKSFSRVIYEKYARVKGLPINPEPETVDDFFYLPFTASPGSYYDGVSVADLYYGEVDPSYFAGKIVLIGPYAAGMQDEYRTAVDHAAPMYGIEFQANQIDAYRNGAIPREAGPLPQFAALFAIAALLVLWFWSRKVTVMTAGWLVVSAGWIALCAVAYRGGLVLHALYVPLAATVLYVAMVAVNYIRAAREKRHITATFGRYVDPAVLPELLKQGDTEEALKGQTFEIAVLFVDIRGFTTMSEALPPTQVVSILNRYLTLTTECVMKNHGTLDKFVGDCTMAFWNAPLPQEDAVYLACRAAMDMVEGSKALGEELQRQFGRTVSFGVGVHVGPAVVGNIGAPQRMDYTAIGDTVNTSARLEANAPGGKVLISRAVADALGERAKVTSLGSSIKLKGKAEGFECLTLDSLEQ